MFWKYKFKIIVCFLLWFFLFFFSIYFLHQQNKLFCIIASGTLICWFCWGFWGGFVCLFVFYLFLLLIIFKIFVIYFYMHYKKKKKKHRQILMLQIFPSLLTLFTFPFILKGIQMLIYTLQNGKQSSAEGWLPWAVKKKNYEGRQWLGKFKDLYKILTILSVFLILVPRESIQAGPWSWLHKLDLFSIQHISNIVKKGSWQPWSSPQRSAHQQWQNDFFFGFVHWKHCRNVFGRRGERSTEIKKKQIKRSFMLPSQIYPWS